jgi:hypothetical protein
MLRDIFGKYPAKPVNNTQIAKTIEIVTYFHDDHCFLHYVADASTNEL